MERIPLIAVIGPGDKCSESLRVTAEKIGTAIGKAGYNLISGGRRVGVMDAVSKGAKKNGSMVIGILPGMDNSEASEWLDISIITGAGSARNNFIVLSAEVVIALGKGAGTFSEIALAIKAKKPLILFKPSKNLFTLAKSMGKKIYEADSVDKVIKITKKLIG